MNPFLQIFSQRKAFIAYITAGHRGLDYTWQAAIALANNGVDILEIGMPFSDPIADGSVIQQAMQDALSHSVTLQDVLQTIAAIKQTVDVPIVLFTYYNSLLQAMNQEDFLLLAKSRGVDAILVVDLPLEESSSFLRQCAKAEIIPIALMAPATTDERICQISAQSEGFIYYVCRNDVTGLKSELPADYVDNVSRIKRQTNIPVVAGFGIAARQTAAMVLQQADGFVVGSAFVKAISEGATPDELATLATTIDPR